MCGIAGWRLARDAAPGPESAEAIARALRHRGPDDSGMLLEPGRGLALVHTRLSIVEPGPGGRQPMRDPASGAVLVFNGEIYNHAALRETLLRHGRQFRSRSDTEVLLHALGEWGMDALARVRGMYAFAYWSPATDTLHLARDPMGIKPLYYRPGPGGVGLAFASELKALLALPGPAPRVNRRALRQFLEFGYTFDPHETILEGVRKLAPGHRLEITGTRAGAPLRHFDPDLRLAPAAQGPALEQRLHDALEEVVGEHLVADVPVALLLSGGLDSSVLAAFAARRARLHTFSFGFADSAVDERPHGRRVAQHLGTEHEDFLITPADLLDGLQDAVAHFDDLFADWGLVSTRLAYQRCRARGAKVVIVGEGADELFGGYHGRFAPGLATAPPAPMDLRLFRLYRRYVGRRYGRLFGPFRARMRSHLADAGGDLFAAIRLFETRDQLPNNFVMKVDKASMSVSVEARVPFLDERIARIAYQTPGDLLVDAGGTKRLLRAMARRYRLLPDDVVERDKFGAGIATAWMQDSAAFREHAARVVLERDGWTEALGLRRAMTAYFRGGRSGYPFPHPIGIFASVAWRLVLLELWSRRLGLGPSHG